MPSKDLNVIMMMLNLVGDPRIYSLDAFLEVRTPPAERVA